MEAPDSPGDQQFEGDHMQQVPPTVATRSEHSIGARRIPRPQQGALFVDSPMTPATPSEPLPGERFESEHRPPVPIAARTTGGGRQHLQVQGSRQQSDMGALHDEELEQRGRSGVLESTSGIAGVSSGSGSSLMACSAPNPRYHEVAKAPPSPLQQPSRGKNGINGTSSSSTNKKSGWCIGQTASSVQRRGEQHEPKSTASSQPPSDSFVPPPRGPPPHQQIRKNEVRGQMNPSSASAARVELQKEGSHGGHSHSTTVPVRAPQGSGSATPLRQAAATAPNTSRGPGPASPNATSTLLAALRQGRLKGRGGEVECADAGGGRENEQKLKSSAPQGGDLGKAKVEAAASSSNRGTLAGGLGSPSHLDENARRRKQKKKR